MLSLQGLKTYDQPKENQTPCLQVYKYQLSIVQIYPGDPPQRPGWAYTLPVLHLNASL